MNIPEPTGPPYINPDNEQRQPVCGICPATRFPRDEFVVYSRPSWQCPFHPDNGQRYALDGSIPACVHPDKIGLEADRIAPPPRPQSSSRRSWWRHPWDCR